MTTIRDDVLCVWVVYERPADYPNGFVARLFKLDQPLNEIVVTNTLDEVRTLILDTDPNLICMQRNDEDPPHVVETWL